MTSDWRRDIAIVDDDQNLREALCDLLEAEGYRCDQYESADRFLQLEGYRSVDCILTDLRMPGRSGLALLQSLRDIPDCPPILIMTSSTDVREAALDSGAFAYLIKPVHGRLLLENVRQALNRRKTSD